MKRIVLILLTLCSVSLSAQQRTPDDIIKSLEAAIAELRALFPSPPPPSQTERVVTSAAELTAALADSTVPVIRLAQGTYTVNLVIMRPVTLTGARGLSGRVAPGDVADYQIVAKDRFLPALTVLGSDVLVSGVTLTGVAPDRSTVIVGYKPAATDPISVLPARVTLDQVAVLGTNGLGHRGVEMHGVDLKLTNSHVDGILERFRQSQGVWVAYGPGPYLIENNYIAASGENILFGGDDPNTPGLVPSDIIIRNNFLEKPQAWRQQPNSVANVLELKNAQRVLIEGNVLDGSWVDIQTGNGLVLTPRDQYGKAPWSTVRDVVVRGNTIRNCDGYAVQTLGTDNNFPSGRLTNITFDRNLFLTASGITNVGGYDGDLIITNNTMPAITRAVLTFNGPTPPAGAGSPGRPNLTFTRNVVLSGRFGVNSQFGGGSGSPTINNYTTVVNVRGNIIEENLGWGRWPSGNTILAAGQLAPRLDAQWRYVADLTLGW